MSLNHYYCYATVVHTNYNSFYKWTKISALETTIFGSEMMVKSGLDFFFILKLNEPLQRYLLTCQANSAFLGRFFALGSSKSEGARGI